MHFSPLADSFASPTNPLYLLRDDLLRRGLPLTDLVRGNVNEHGIVFPQEALKDILREAAGHARVYHPDSLGQEPARTAVSQYYGGMIPPRQILITPGTSVSYWYCFKLLAQAGDEILTPTPSYPLFDYIARLCDVNLTTYRLDESSGWAIDLDHLESQVSSRTRAIVLISPHNPTGMVASRDQLKELAFIAARYELPILSDEVFSEFLFGMESLPRPAETDAPLVFTLNGFSKMFALPGLKFGWIGISGDENLVARSVSALEMISDTFLPVNETVQFAAPGIFEAGRGFLGSYKTWVAACRNNAVESLDGCSFVQPAGGFYLTLSLPHDEEETALRLLRDSQILAHPGYFYDIPPDHLVTTFVHDPETVRRTFARIARSLVP